MVPRRRRAGGRLAVRDTRTGNDHEVEVTAGGTLSGADLRKIAPPPGTDVAWGLRVYDPGYVNTVAVRSKVSYIDGGRGVLRYRGYPIEELAESSSFLETAYLVIYGHLPSQEQASRWEEAVMRHSALPEGVQQCIAALPHDSHPMGVMMTGMAALGAFHPEANPAISGNGIYKGTGGHAVRDKQIVRILGKAPALAAAAYHRKTGRRPPPPQQGLGYAESFLYMLDAAADGSTGYRPNPRLAKALDIMFVLHAEHEMNCSTAAARHLASSGVDVYTAISGATGALYGPLHGGANEAVLRMLDRIGTVENIPAFLEGVKNRQEKLFGFGHRVYKNFDPRAKIIRRVADEVFEITGKDPLIQVATELERAALTDEYFVKRKLYPNVDFYSGLVYRAMGFPPDFFTCLFTIPRCAGWLAHWRESLDDPDARIIRPQQDYQGVWLRHYESMGARPDVVEGDDVTPLEPSNAYKRRLAGTGAW